MEPPRTPRSRYRTAPNTPIQSNRSPGPWLYSPIQASRSPGPLATLLARLTKCSEFNAATIQTAVRDLVELGSQIDTTLTQDEFRRAYGFQTLLKLIESVASMKDQPDSTLGKSLVQLCIAVLSVFSKALMDHHGNRRYFATRALGGGWRVLERVIESLMLHLPKDALLTREPNSVMQLIKQLVDLATDAFKHSSASKQSNQSAADTDASTQRNDAGTPDDKATNGNGASDDHDQVSTIPLDNAKEFAQSIVADAVRVTNGRAVRLLAVLYNSCQERDFDLRSGLSTSLAILAVINQLAVLSRHNKVAIHHAGVLSLLLPGLSSANLSSPHGMALAKFCECLLELGSNQLDETAELFRQASESDAARQVLLKALRQSKQPATIQFDFSSSGHCSIELPALPRVFPPTSGYSFAAWVRIDQFDAESHTTLFGAFDATQTCFVLIYIEKDTHQLILQTSVTSSKPSVRFKKAKFRAGEWYHVALVHRPAKPSRLSQVALYLNGRFVDEIHSQYPEVPPLLPEPRQSHALPQTTASRRRSVEAFLGTPQDLAFRPAGRTNESQWSLANSHLYDTCLSLDIVAVQAAIGPRYSGNFQDCIGAFLTYRASAELNRYNEAVYREKSDKTEIVQMTQHHGSETLPESKILVSLSASSISDVDGVLGGNLDIKDFLSDKALHQYHSLTRNGNSIIFNAARPAVKEAVMRAYGAAIITGNPTIHHAQALDEATWQIGGSLPITMKIFQTADTDDAITASVEILFECIEDNWRTSEAMEKGDGFGVLAILLREKLELGHASPQGSLYKNIVSQRKSSERDALALRLLKTILKFVGYDAERPERSLLINPMAYRILLVDFDTWRTVSVECQKLYFQQISDFIWKNNHQAFNMKRFNRNRIVRKLLDALKVDSVTAEVLPCILQALRSISLCRNSHISHRDFATFITYALHDEQALGPMLSSTKSARSASVRTARTPTLDNATPPAALQSVDSFLSKREIGTRVLETYAQVLCAYDNVALIKKFDLQVPPRWLLQLACEPDARVAAAALAIISRCLVEISGFKSKLLDKNAGFAILQSRLRSQWSSPKVWMSCFAIFFGRPFVSEEPMDDMTLFHLVDVFVKHEEPDVQTPEIFPAISGMLEAGLRSILSDRGADDEKPSTIPKTIIQFLADVHHRSQSFRDFAVSSGYVQEMLFVLFPVIASADRLSAAAELASDGPLNFQGKDVLLRPHSNSVGERPKILRTGSSKTLPEQARKRVQAPRRTSSFVFVSVSEDVQSPVPARFNAVMSPNKTPDVKIHVDNTVVESLLEVITTVFIDQICQRKDFSGFGLFLKVPPGFQEHQAYFESFVLLHVSHQLWNHLQLNQKLLVEPRVLTNLAKYSLHMAEAVFEGWFINGAQPLLDFTGKILDYLQQPSIASTKAVRLCSQAVTTLRSVFLRVTLLRLSELDEVDDDQESFDFINKLTYWQTILFSPDNQELPFIRLVCYLLYVKLISLSKRVRLASASLWRMLLVQKPTEAATILIQNTESNQRHLSTGLIKLAAHDDEELLQWIDQHRKSLDDFFSETFALRWEEFVASENQKTEESARNRLAKRREKLKQWQLSEAETDNVLHHHDKAARHSRSNIHAQERLKFQGIVQDQQENLSHLQTVISRFERQLRQPCGLFPDNGPKMWQLDRTEARNRMRMRIVPHTQPSQEVYQSKRKASGSRLLENQLRVRTSTAKLRADSLASPASALTPNVLSEEPEEIDAQSRARSESLTASGLLDGEFEMVDDPRDDEEGYEDKNRKVLKSLRRGDRVQNICNVSRILGLEAFEGLMIIGKKCLYLQDALFQRSDGEIVSVSQAPAEERDPYVQMISGKELKTYHSLQRGDREARHWTWEELLSISKRRFLFRDVALEVFFTDGRSYLLTFMTPKIRDEVYSYLMKKAPHMQGDLSTLSAEDAWRLDTLRNPDETPQSIGSKLSSVFNSTHSNAATRRWMRGEISNFQYLMLVNTMAGRTFNDLTQYPIFPWVLADYTSHELDLTDPRSFRDLSKPMGCQNPSRESDFRERYRSFAEMGDDDSPPFHYGTHYSTAMIVSSYLIRLPPFVQAYLLLQGGSFDHADRLFDSIERAWLSASRDNMTDVRELTPEFFYLPEFLTNVNHYDFGQKQGSNEPVDDVHLPPWAKGDPHIFIAKHREALESAHVTQHLQEWIDLIFGYKQRGEAALEATNVFHHLSYQGAKDLEAMQDSHEKLATISFIHNFGQTPHQVFNRAHPRKSDDDKTRVARLDTITESLVKTPLPAQEGQEKISSLSWSTTQDRLMSSTPCRAYLPPSCKVHVQWGYSDNSLRFFSTSASGAAKHQLGLYEGTHVGPISTLMFADSKTLITGGADATIGVWNIAPSSSGNDSISMTSRTYLFGHRTPIALLTTSRAFSTLLSVSTDGHALLWDLNRFDCIRVLRPPPSPSPSLTTSPSSLSSSPDQRITTAIISNLTGHIALCAPQTVQILTLNGHVLLTQRLCDRDDPDDEITSCAFYEGERGEWVERTLLFTGHGRDGGVVNVWSLVTLGDGTWWLQLVKRMCNLEGKSGGGGGSMSAASGRASAENGVQQAGRGSAENGGTAMGRLTLDTRAMTLTPGRERGGVPAATASSDGAVTAILPTATTVFVGDEQGRVFEWACAAVKETKVFGGWRV